MGKYHFYHDKQYFGTGATQDRGMVWLVSNDLWEYQHENVEDEYEVAYAKEHTDASSYRQQVIVGKARLTECLLGTFGYTVLMTQYEVWQGEVYFGRVIINSDNRFTICAPKNEINPYRQLTLLPPRYSAKVICSQDDGENTLYTCVVEVINPAPKISVTVLPERDKYWIDVSSLSQGYWGIKLLDGDELVERLLVNTRKAGVDDPLQRVANRTNEMVRVWSETYGFDNVSVSLSNTFIHRLLAERLQQL